MKFQLNHNDEQKKTFKKKSKEKKICCLKEIGVLPTRLDHRARAKAATTTTKGWESWKPKALSKKRQIGK